MVLHQIDAQLLRCEEGREDFRWNIDKRRGAAALMGFLQSPKTLGADRVYIDSTVLRSATSFDQSKNFNKSKKNLIDGVISSDHIR